MSKPLNIIWQYLRAFVLIYACLYAGIFIASLLPITIPGSIIGMLILFVLLALQILPAKWVNPGCFILIRYMALLFVPIGVGVMQYFDLLKAQFGPIVVSCAVSTLVVFLVVSWSSHLLAARFKMPLLNPLLVAMVVIIPFLLLTGIPYERYFAGSKILNDLLQPAVVALAFPLYEQLHQIRARWKSIITICFVGSLVAMITGTSVALLMGASPQIAASILPKSVTTPIAMAVGGSLGGIPAISAMCVIFVGILGAVFGHTLLNGMRIRTKAARGLSMGTASHALGTARCAELDYQEGAFSSLALVICGIITSLLAPFIFPLILAVMG
ncbi:hypothetical protein ID866_773 [Astraeus odoratus]|nr:hypothetical protein ID866_773 [Astraeus odoratus]